MIQTFEDRSIHEVTSSKAVNRKELLVATWEAVPFYVVVSFPAAVQFSGLQGPQGTAAGTAFRGLLGLYLAIRTSKMWIRFFKGAYISHILILVISQRCRILYILRC